MSSGFAELDDLERALREVGARLDVPPTPDVAMAVRARLEARPRRRGWLRPRLAWALVVLLAALAVLSSPTVAKWLGLPGIRIQFGPPSRAPFVTDVRLGTPLGLSEAQGRVPFRVVTPAALGAPDEVYLDEPPSGGRVSLIYRARPGLPRAAETGIGLLIVEFEAQAGDVFVKRIATTGTTVESVTVGEARGFWISGRPHVLVYRTRTGMRDEAQRLAGNTLVWEHGGVIYRLESALSRDEALRIAASMR